jgi:hypothetical protein
LIEITRIIVVDRAPGKVPQVAYVGAEWGRRGRSSLRLGKRCGRKLGLEAASDHRLPRYAQQQSSISLHSHAQPEVLREEMTDVAIAF